MNQQQIEEFIDQSKNSLISTIDQEGYPVTRAMLSVRLRDGLNKLYFSTYTHSHKIAQIKNNSKGSVYFFDPNRFIGVLLTGQFETSQELELKKQIWQEHDELYYPQGVTDQDYSVMIFSIQKIRIYADMKVEEIQ